MADPFAPSWQQGVTITSPDDHGGTITQNANPYQWASQGTANQVANMTGGTAYGQNITSPGGAYSSPMQMISYGNGGPQTNAGLAAQEYANYGTSPAGYGSYLVDRDAKGVTQGGDPGFNQWSLAHGGVQSGPTGSADTASSQSDYLNNMANFYRANGLDPNSMFGGQGQGPTPQGQQQQMQTQPYMGGGGGGQQGGGGQPPSPMYASDPYQSNGGQNPMSGIGSIMSLLNMLFPGMFGGGGMSGGGFGMQMPPQRPPALTQGNGSYPFYSHFS